MEAEVINNDLALGSGLDLPLDTRAGPCRHRWRSRARLQPLGHVAHQLDAEQAVLELGAVDLDMVGQLEAQLERAAGNAAVQELASLVLGVFAPRMLRAFSLTSIFSSSWLKPATAIVMRYALSETLSML